jgi:hypothetical protein
VKSYILPQPTPFSTGYCERVGWKNESIFSCFPLTWCVFAPLYEIALSVWFLITDNLGQDEAVKLGPLNPKSVESRSVKSRVYCIKICYEPPQSTLDIWKLSLTFFLITFSHDWVGFQ